MSDSGWNTIDSDAVCISFDGYTILISTNNKGRFH